MAPHQRAVRRCGGGGEVDGQVMDSKFEMERDGVEIEDYTKMGV